MKCPNFIREYCILINSSYKDDCLCTICFINRKEGSRRLCRHCPLKVKEKFSDYFLMAEVADNL